MDESPAGSLNNPAVMGRFKQYARPIQYSQRPKPRLFSDVTDQFSHIYQADIDKTTTPSVGSQNQFAPQKVVEQISPVQTVAQPIPQVSPALSAQTQAVPLQHVREAQPQIVQERVVSTPQSNQSSIAHPAPQAQQTVSDPIEEAIPVAASVDEPAVLPLVQQSPQPHLIAPIYKDNYDGEYEDVKRRRFGFGGGGKGMKKFILGSSMVVTIFLAGAFVMFMNWNNNRSVAQAQSRNISSIQSTGINLPTNTKSTISYASTIVPTPQQLSAYTVGPALPRYLIIPELGVDSEILPINLNNNDNIEAPDNIFSVGWWQSSSVPGQSGATVLDGFTTNGNQSGVFSTLSQLKPGDKFEVETGSGAVVNYQVVQSVEFGTNKLTMNQAISPVISSRPGLNIITCHGLTLTCPSSDNADFVVFSEQIGEN